MAKTDPKKLTSSRMSAAAKKRDMGCRAPRCKRRSCGPRFHYLCETHRHVAQAQVEEWAGAYAIRKAAAKKRARAA